MHTRDLDFFGRQRDLFSHWLGEFDDDWRTMRFDDSFRRFEHQLDRIRRDMHRMDSHDLHIQVRCTLEFVFVGKALFFKTGH